MGNFDVIICDIKNREKRGTQKLPYAFTEQGLAMLRTMVVDEWLKMNTLPTSESGKVEFKTSFNEDVIESLVAFSNAKGGTVFIGVADGGKVKGIQIGKETLQNWINEVKNKTSPQIIPEVEVLTIESKIVVAISAMEYPIKPVSKSGRFYKRIANANHLMSIDEIPMIRRFANTNEDNMGIPSGN